MVSELCLYFLTLNFKVNKMLDLEELPMKFANPSDERSVINVAN